ncbi:MAG: efflux RND transporter periplasmic adaptor subunit [Gammaproteobacteria bacterium]
MKVLWSVYICIGLLLSFNTYAKDEHDHAQDEPTHVEQDEGEHEGEHEEDDHAHDEPSHAEQDEDEHEGEHEEDAHAHDEPSHAEQGEGGHDDEHEEQLVLSEKEIEEFEIRLDKAGSGSIKETLTLPGEITTDPDHLIHVVPRVSGITRQVYKTLGDSVKKGDLLATLSSRELAEIKAEVEAAKSRYELAITTYDREQKLKKEGLTSEREFLEAQQVRDNAYIEYNLAKQKLRAIGLDQNISQCNDNCDLTLYEIRSPGDGVITEKHIVQGELLNEESLPFVISKLDHVWINLTVYQKDLGRIETGQQVRVVSGYGIPDVESIIDYISPKVSEKTRSATARIIIDNNESKWRPGLFVSVAVTLSDFTSDIVIPKTAIETIDNQSVVFIKTDEGFEPHPVKLGRSDRIHIEVLDGLHEGEQYVTKNAFVLKAQMQKASFGDGHGH